MRLIYADHRLPDAELNYQSYSRIWVGIHFRHEMVAGKEIGLAVAQQVLAWEE